MKQTHEPAWKRLLRTLETGSTFNAIEASKVLSKCRSRNCLDALTALMLRNDSPRASELAAYTLAWTHNGRFVRAYTACLRDRNQHESVRRQAAEAIGLLYDCSSTQNRERRAAESTLLEALCDPSPTVRFWCCYALGCLRSSQAILPLEHLRNRDTAFVPGWWYVHEEAVDALSWISGKAPDEDRVPVHLRHEKAT